MHFSNNNYTDISLINTMPKQDDKKIIPQLFAESWQSDDENENKKEDENKESQILLNNNIKYDLEEYKKIGKKLINKYEEKGIIIENINENFIMSKWEDLFIIYDNYCKFNKDINLINIIIKNIKDIGWLNPRIVQQISCPWILNGNEIVCQANAGDGKTGVFAISSALLIDPNINKTQIIIISPTSVLTDQTYDIICRLTKNTNIITKYYYAHINYDNNDSIPHIVVGCPGKMFDLIIQRNKIKINNLKMLILDEVDELFNIDFRVHIKPIIESLNDSVQVCVFSATISEDIRKTSELLMNKTKIANIKLPDNKIIKDNIKQWFINCANNELKNKELIDIINKNPNEKIIVFFNTCNKLKAISETLIKLKIMHLCIYKDIDIKIKKTNLEKFMSESHENMVLFASDIGARGIDTIQVSIVINYDIPYDTNTYVHRIGRAGRGDSIGNAISFSQTDQDKYKLKSINTCNTHQIECLKNNKLSFI